MKTVSNWNAWVPSNGIENATRKLFAEKSLWIRKEFFARLAQEGFSSEEWFDKGMHKNEVEGKYQLWPWTSFLAEASDLSLIEGERYIRARRSWNPLGNANTPDVPRIATIKELLNLIEIGLPIAQGLHPRKLAQIVIGNFERMRDRLHNELDHINKMGELYEA